ncbi:MAG: Uma2 family endonuclease [Spirochaetota bacterium]
MVTKEIKQEILIPIESLDTLLDHRLFRMLGEQMFFRDVQTGEYFLTRISEDAKYTADHYSLLPEGAPYQLLEGRLIQMASPYSSHQKITGNLYFLIRKYLEGKEDVGEVFLSPLDVHLDEENIVQPDILFVSIRRSSIVGKFVFGAPDFVVEVISKGSKNTDEKIKLALYGKFDVTEYWLIYPEKHTVDVYHNKLGVMVKKQTAQVGEQIESKAIEGFTFSLRDIF